MRYLPLAVIVLLPLGCGERAITNAKDSDKDVQVKDGHVKIDLGLPGEKEKKGNGKPEMPSLAVLPFKTLGGSSSPVAQACSAI